MFISSETERHLSTSRIARSITLVIVAVLVFMGSLAVSLLLDLPQNPFDQATVKGGDVNTQIFTGTVTEVSLEGNLFQMFVDAETAVYTVSYTEPLNDLSPGMPIVVRGTIDPQDDGLIHSQEVTTTVSNDTDDRARVLIEIGQEDVMLIEEPQ